MSFFNHYCKRSSIEKEKLNKTFRLHKRASRYHVATSGDGGSPFKTFRCVTTLEMNSNYSFIHNKMNSKIWPKLHHMGRAEGSYNPIKCHLMLERSNNSKSLLYQVTHTKENKKSIILQYNNIPLEIWLRCSDFSWIIKHKSHYKPVKSWVHYIDWMID